MTRQSLAALLALAGAGLGLPAALAAQEAAAPEPAAESPAAPDPAAPEPGAIAEMTLGDPAAPVAMIEYASFTCPHCARFHTDVFPLLRQEFIDTGLVHYIYREVYFDRPGLWASMVARCGGEMRFFGITGLLYEGQAEWAGAGEPAAIAEELRRIGRVAGLDDPTLDACLTDEAKAEALVAWFQANAEADGIDSTPSFVIDGERHGNMPWEEMRALLRAELAEAGAE
jgi:protein-disulfide isomerase